MKLPAVMRPQGIIIQLCISTKELEADYLLFYGLQTWLFWLSLTALIKRAVQKAAVFRCAKKINYCFKAACYSKEKKSPA